MNERKKERKKFLGVDEADQQENKVVLKKAETEVIRRVSVILDTPFLDHNKMSAIDIFALPVLTYFMPVIYFSQEDLNEIDLKIKRLLTERGARHPQHLNILLYGARSVGGRGLNRSAQHTKRPRSRLQYDWQLATIQNYRQYGNFKW